MTFQKTSAKETFYNSIFFLTSPLLSSIPSSLKYSLCVTCPITVKLVGEEDVKPRVHWRFLGLHVTS